MTAQPLDLAQTISQLRAWTGFERGSKITARNAADLLESQREQIAALREALEEAQKMRPMLLRQYQAVPECVLAYCNVARAALEATK